MIKKSKYGSMTLEESISISIDVHDVTNFILYHATSHDLMFIKSELGYDTSSTTSVVDDMKRLVCEKAMNKYSLEELENMLNLSYF
jgi:hypothetical protein